jgi:hypothetical protein
VATVACVGVSAQPAPIKPGLWQIQVEQDGQDMSAQMRQMQEQMKAMPPEQRKQVEAMMKQHGVSMSGPGDMKVCLSKEQLAEGRGWEGQREPGNCKTDTKRSGNTWKFHSSCPAPHKSETDGEATFESAESYTVKSTTTVGEGAQSRMHKMTAKSQWLGADCGDIKPMRPRPSK